MYRTLECLSNHAPQCKLEQQNPINYCTATIYCLRCNAMFTESSIVQHARMHAWRELNKIDYACLICCILITDEAKFLRHLRLHQDDPKYIVTESEVAEYRFEQSYKYLQCDDFPTRHDDFLLYGNYLCNQCSDLFCSEQELAVHMISSCARNQ